MAGLPFYSIYVLAFIQSSEGWFKFSYSFHNGGDQKKVVSKQLQNSTIWGLGVDGWGVSLDRWIGEIQSYHRADIRLKRNFHLSSSILERTTKRGRQISNNAF